jgi:hypothetical protein
MFGKNWMVQIAIVATMLLLGACDESEQGRIWRYEKGTYLGQADTPLSEGQVDELRRRALLQGSD